MTTKTATQTLTKQEASWLDTIESCLAEMTVIRKRMKATDQRIRHADSSIRRNLDETRDILRHVQAGR